MRTTASGEQSRHNEHRHHAYDDDPIYEQFIRPPSSVTIPRLE
jgi:hypothetical protein